MPRMDTLSRPADGARPPVELAGPLAAGQAALTRRTLLRVAGGGLIAAGLVACAPAAVSPKWSFGPTIPPRPSGDPVPSASASASMSHGPEPSTGASSPPVDHDANALAVVQALPRRRGAPSMAAGNPPLEPRSSTATQGLRAHDRRDRAPDRRAEGRRSTRSASTAPGRDRGSTVTRVTRSARPSRTTWPSRPASTSTGSAARTPWTACRTSPRTRSSLARRSPTSSSARTPGSHMYHSHHNATDQVGRGLLGAFIVEPRTRPSATSTLLRGRARTSSGSATMPSAASRSTAAASRPPPRSSRRSARRSSSAS